MKKLLVYPALLLTLVFNVGQLLADALPDPATDQSSAAQYSGTTDTTLKLDPTLAFFVALSSCKPGVYQEHNILSDNYGQDYLTQQIIGAEDGVCNVVLATPDRRTMQCQFSEKDLANFNDQHFLAGMLNNTTAKPSQPSINADTLWAEMKNQSCTFAKDDE